MNNTTQKSRHSRDRIFALVDVTGLAVCFAYYPLADRTASRAVPVCALFAQNSPQDCFLSLRPSQVRALQIEKITSRRKSGNP